MSQQTAVLVIDMQNDTIGAAGAYASSGAVEHAQAQGVVANVQRVLDAAREENIPVFHSRIIVRSLTKTSGSNAPVFRMLAPDTFRDGTWGAEIVNELKPQSGEIVLDRTRMSVFNGTEIDILLRNLEVQTLIVTGAWTNMAVEHTIRDAADHGYRVTVVSDATSSLNEEWQHAALSYAVTNIAEVVETATLVDRLRA